MSSTTAATRQQHLPKGIQIVSSMPTQTISLSVAHAVNTWKKSNEPNIYHRNSSCSNVPKHKMRIRVCRGYDGPILPHQRLSPLVSLRDPVLVHLRNQLVRRLLCEIKSPSQRPHGDALRHGVSRMTIRPLEIVDDHFEKLHVHAFCWVLLRNKLHPRLQS